MQHRRVKVAELYLKGNSQDEIALELGVHQTTVSIDLKEVRKVWALSVRLQLEELRDEEIARLAKIERAAWTEFALNHKAEHLKVLVKCVELWCKLLDLLKEPPPSGSGVAEAFWGMIAGVIQTGDDEDSTR